MKREVAATTWGLRRSPSSSHDVAVPLAKPSAQLRGRVGGGGCVGVGAACEVRGWHAVLPERPPAGSRRRPPPLGGPPSTPLHPSPHPTIASGKAAIPMSTVRHGCQCAKPSALTQAVSQVIAALAGPRTKGEWPRHHAHVRAQQPPRALGGWPAAAADAAASTSSPARAARTWGVARRQEWGASGADAGLKWEAIGRGRPALPVCGAAQPPSPPRPLTHTCASALAHWGPRQRRRAENDVAMAISSAVTSALMMPGGGGGVERRRPGVGSVNLGLASCRSAEAGSQAAAALPNARSHSMNQKRGVHGLAREWRTPSAGGSGVAVSRGLAREAAGLACHGSQSGRLLPRCA
jgi:hypothetical protein